MSENDETVRQLRGIKHLLWVVLAVLLLIFAAVSSRGMRSDILDPIAPVAIVVGFLIIAHRVAVVAMCLFARLRAVADEEG